jgi:ribonuclease VapC
MSIVVDASALVAIVLGEPDAPAYAAVLVGHAGDAAVSAATYVEASIIVRSRQGPEAAADLDRLLATTSVEIAPIDERHAAIAVAAWERFGKGRHEAALNFGDCFSYALAKERGAALLFKGDDFARTDIASAM